MSNSTPAMAASPLVSVIMPTYNRAYSIRRAIDSVLNQTMGDFEFLIIDDGSTDNTEEVIGSYTDPRIHYVKCEKNRGCCAANNRGFAIARGKYIARIDSDDKWLPHKLETQLTYMEAHPEIAVCFGYVHLIDGSDRIINEQYPDTYNIFRKDFTTQEQWLRHFFTIGNCLNNVTYFMRSECVRDIGGYNPSYWNNEDFEYWLRVVSRYPIHVIPEELIHYRWEPDQDQLSNTDSVTMVGVWNLMTDIRRHFFDFMSDEDFIRWFGTDFRNPNSRSDLELRCEKAFLQLKYPYHGASMVNIAVDQLTDIMKDPDGARILEKAFSFSCRDLFKLRCEHCQVARPDELKLAEELRLTRQHADNLQTMLDNIQNSGSYRTAQKLSSAKKKLLRK